MKRKAKRKRPTNRELLEELLAGQEAMMAAIDALTAEVARTVNLDTQVLAILSQPPVTGVPEEQVQTQADNLKAANDQLEAALTARG